LAEAAGMCSAPASRFRIVFNSVLSSTIFAVLDGERSPAAARPRLGGGERIFGNGPDGVILSSDSASTACTLVCGLSVFDPEAEAGRFRAVGGGAIARGLESAETARVVLREGVGGEDFGVEVVEGSGCDGCALLD